MPESPWIIIEPYYGGSHRHLVDGLVARLPGPFELWTLPPRTWKWRMRGAALHFADRWRRERPRAAGIFTTSLLDAAALRGLLPPEAAALPFVLYCHENQLNYPVRVADKRDYHYGWTNIQSVAAADRVLWNSAYNLESFLEELPEFLKRMPDARPQLSELGDSIRSKSEVLPVPADLNRIASRQRPPRAARPRLLWNHRWEHDKGPDECFAALVALAGEGHEFELSVVGQVFQETPAIFEEARVALADRILCWGFQPSREAYERELLGADLALSTARHEFQGLAILEAAAAGCDVLVPDALSYREIWPASRRYPPGELLPALRARLEGWEGESVALREIALGFDWSVLLPRWAELFAGQE